MSTQTTINDVPPRTQITATGGQTVFTTNWTANAASDVVVYSRTSIQEADDQTQEVSPNDYSVAFIGGSEIVEVTFLVGRQAGDIITISRDTPADRLNLYTNTNFTPSMLNQDVGILTLVDQQAQLYDTQLAPHYNVSCTFTDTNDLAIDNILPILDAKQFWVKNYTNTAIVAATLDNSNLPAAGPFVTWTADASLANAQDLGQLNSGILNQTVVNDVSTISSLPIPLTVPNGGTGTTSITARSVVLGGTTNTGNLRTVSGLGTAGQLLTSQGAGVDPIWASPQQVGSVNIVRFTSNGVWNKPANLAFISVELMGGGGGGGGCPNSGATGHLISGGGGAGGYRKAIFGDSVLGPTYNIVVGAGGLGGVAGAAGGNGGDSEFNLPTGGVLLAYGGFGGTNTPVPGAASLISISGSGTVISTPGAAGQGGMGSNLNTTNFSMGAGANTMWGAGGAPSTTNATANGAAATGFGAGGAGGVSINAGGASNGGDGAPGIVIIIEYLKS